MSMILSAEELVELTGRQRRSAQVAALRCLGIEHRTRPDGTLVVLRAHVEQVLAGTSGKVSKARVIEPNWKAA